MRILKLLSVTMLFLLVACGGGASPGATPSPTTGQGAAGSEMPMTPVPTEAHGMMPPMDGGHGGEAHMPFDQMFIIGMTAHHQSAIDMAKIALQRAEHPEVKQLAREIIKAQQAEIDQMRDWYRQWYGASQVPRPDEDMMGSMPGMHGEGMMGTDLDELRRAKPFDKAFIDAMIPHHQGAVSMARMALRRAEHPEVRKMAQNIIETQQAEIDQMRRWRKAWYGAP